MRKLIISLVALTLCYCTSPDPQVIRTMPKKLTVDQMLRQSNHVLDMKKVGRKINRDFRRLDPDILEYVVTEADRKGVSPSLALALLYQESEGKPWARSPVGALGLMQIMPRFHYNGPAWHLTQDEALNIRLGMKYLRTCLRITKSEWQAVQAYNTGHDAWLNGARSQTHARRVYAIRKALQKELERISDREQRKHGRQNKKTT